MKKVMQKAILLAFFVSLMPAYAQERDSGIYISPNNDGVKDALEFPIQIRDKRYVQSWAFIIENEAGEVVRTIENKDSRPEMETTGGFAGVMRSIWRMITRVKRGIAVPETLRWDGTMDSGAVAPDGKYLFHVTASDDNGNTSATERIAFYVDNTAPEISALPPAGPDGMVFSPDGDNNKDTFEIAQSGSAEDLWEIAIFNAAGAAVREEAIRGQEPSDFVWDGKDSEGGIVPDGVYSYRISATDRAGNRGNAEIHNIIVNTVRPTIGAAISASAFSPNGDGSKDTIEIIPSIPVTEGLQRWTVSIIGEDGEERRVFDYSTSRGSASPQAIVFDGKDARGNTLPEGRYTARITAEYSNGHRPEATTSAFSLDITPPSASITASTSIFSPAGGGALGEVTFTQQVSQESGWLAEIVPAGGGEPVRSISFVGQAPETFVWNGRDDSGAIVPDGVYEYVLSSTDEAGNSGVFRSGRVSLNTERADLILQSNTTAFSPNGDGRKDTVTFTPVIRAQTPAARYTLEVRDEAGRAVRSFGGEGAVPARIVWDGADNAGKACPNGTYTAHLSVTLANMQTSSADSPPILLDTQYPSIEVAAQWLLFSPNEQSARKTLPITQRSSEEALWRAEIRNSRGAVVRSLSWQGRAQDFQWDARDNSGNRVPDGAYSYTISSEDEAGNVASRTIEGITVDSRAPQVYITAELSAFSPNGDSIADIQSFSIGANIRDSIESWEISIVPAEGSDETVAKSWSSARNGALPERLEWDGKANNGSALEGRYRALLSVSYEKGERAAAITPAFLINITPPELAVSLSPRFFSPDNDGIDDDLFISLSAKSLSPFEEWSFEIREPEGTAGRVFWQTGGRGTITERIIWDGRSNEGELVQAAMDYPFTFTVRDNVGMTSTVRGYVPVDVLVIRDGNNLKIAVPSIIFAKDVATFDGLDPHVTERNNQILRRVAEILNRFKSYNVVIEGHANNVSGTEREETAELVPLSQARADAIKVILQGNGVNGSRLSTVGIGGRRPVATREDRDNWWKNRRVEFILIK